MAFSHFHKSDAGAVELRVNDHNWTAELVWYTQPQVCRPLANYFDLIIKLQLAAVRSSAAGVLGVHDFTIYFGS